MTTVRVRVERHGRVERGQTTILIVGFAIVLMMAVGVVVDASAAYLQRQALATLADGAALAAADEVEGAAVYTGGLSGDRAPLDPDRIEAVVHDHLRAVGAHGTHPGLRIEVAVHDDTVLVRLSARLDLPIAVDGLTDARVGARGAASVLLDRS